jgi:hypothetical protein
MICIRSYGNQIRCGNYTLHSKFASAANFISNDRFAFVVDSRVGAGPLNIVIEGIPIDSLQHLEVTDDRLFLNGYYTLSDDSQLYNADITIDWINRTQFIQNLPNFEDALIQYSPQKSLAFLINPARKKEFSTPFDLAIANRIEDGMNLLLQGDYRMGTEKLKGVGYGLTPSGDDFISGFLIALNVCQKIFSADLSAIISRIHNAAKSNNKFTNTFLDCAADGQVSEKFQKLIYVLDNPGKKETPIYTRELLTVGATSGADQAVGFLIGIKRFAR